MTEPVTERIWTIADVVTWTTDDLKKRGITSARLDAELLVGHALQIDRVRVIVDRTRELTANQLEDIRRLVKRRRSHEPVAYLRGTREFFGRPFRVDHRVLVPRPDTEVLVEEALRRMQHLHLGARVLDLCTGSGCVGISLKCERPTWAVDLFDLSPGAIVVARDNAQRLGAVWNLTCAVGDLFEPVAGCRRKYDLIVGNPPYIPAADIPGLAPDIREHEPHLALNGGHDGLDIVRRIAQEAGQYLRNRGVLAMEIGSDQADRTALILTETGFTNVSIQRDYGGLARVVSGVL